MSRYPTDEFAAALPWAGAAVLAVLAGTFVVAKVTGRHSWIDTAWGLLFCAVAIVAFALSADEGNDTRRWLLLALPLVWGLRLTQHIGRRTVGKPEDPRYEQLLAKAQGNADVYALTHIYLLQGVLALLISAPLLVGAFTTGPVGVVAWLGVVVWAVGLFFETVGDAQLERFRANSANKGKVMDVGLWRYTRHPNYFGDACIWWGSYLVAASSWPGVLTAPAPVIMTLLLTKGSGARIMDAHMSQRAGWAEYAARTSGFFPRPPRSAH